MLMVLFLLSVAGDEAPKASVLPDSTLVTPPPRARCENPREQLVREGEAAVPTLRSLNEEPLANAYRPVVRYAHCDQPVVIAKRIGRQQR
ncbi:hypothetical protein [Sphingomonas pituitosa]|uniref:hypothetical protein n=1 Tax=Sphingomonas pituitosa TaxID=99597 RepID=UPI0008296E95|nr:hypothetical protein [Sphingomonas pituitosa]